MFNLIYTSFSSSFLYEVSMRSAPVGAVINIAHTATVSTVSPQLSPIARGTAPMAAWTVALGMYEKAEKIRSFLLSIVLNRHIRDKQGYSDAECFFYAYSS